MGEDFRPTIDPENIQTLHEVSDEVLESYRLSEKPFRVALATDEPAGVYETVTAFISAQIRTGQWLCLTKDQDYFLFEERRNGWMAYQNQLLQYANRGSRTKR